MENFTETTQKVWSLIELWRVARNVWRETCGRKHVARNVWRETCGGKRVARNVWHETCGGKCVARNVWREMCGAKHVARNVWRETCGAKRVARNVTNLRLTIFTPNMEKIQNLSAIREPKPTLKTVRNLRREPLTPHMPKALSQDFKSQNRQHCFLQKHPDLKGV